MKKAVNNVKRPTDAAGKPVVQAGSSSREAIMVAARQAAKSRGYAGLNFRDLADVVGIKSASMYHHFATKAELGASVARRYWQDTAMELDAMFAEDGDPLRSLHRYPDFFRRSLADGNRLCLCSFMSAEYDDLPDTVKAEVQTFSDVNVAWLSKALTAAGLANRKASERRAKAIYAAVAGAQLMARSRGDITVFDALIDGYRNVGLLPA